MSNKWENCVFARGYLITKEEIEHKGVPENWNTEKFGYADALYKISFDPRNDFIFQSNKNYWVMILGTVVDIRNQTMDLNEIAGRILDYLFSNERAFYDYIDEFSGRHIIMYGNRKEVKILQDATGMRSLYYHLNQQCIASHYNLINLQYTSKEDTYWDTYNGLLNKPWYLPGRCTPYEDIKVLTPNCEIILSDMKVRRFFPRNEVGYKNMDVDDVYNAICDILRIQVRTLVKQKKLMLSLTKGNDSRLSLAVMKEIKDRILCFSFYDISAPIDYSEDALFAESMCKEHGISFKRIDVKEELDNELVKIIKENHYHSHKAKAVQAYIANLPDEYLHIRSNLLEIIRNREYFLMDENSSRSMAQCAYAKNEISELCQAKFDDFYACADYDKLNKDYISDLFYWEYRMGVWHASGILLETDIAFDTYCLYNCRKLLRLGLSVPRYLRNKNLVIYECINKLWPIMNYNIPNSKDTLYDYMHFENHGYYDMTKCHVSAIGEFKKPSIYIKKNKSQLMLGFGSNSICKGDTIIANFDYNLKQETYLIQITTMCVWKAFLKKNKVKYQILIDGMCVYDTDLADFFSKTNQINIFYKNEVINSNSKIRFRLIAQENYTNLEGCCGYIEIKALYISAPLDISLNEKVKVFSTKDIYYNVLLESYNGL